ncbi:MAG: hypothetical protein Q9227_002672 [Pyrenula ochraceoflavens]
MEPQWLTLEDADSMQGKSKFQKAMKTDETLPDGRKGSVQFSSYVPADAEEDDEEEEEESEPVKVMKTVGTFEELLVWGHDAAPAADDPFVKGVEEWTAFAEAVR